MRVAWRFLGSWYVVILLAALLLTGCPQSLPWFQDDDGPDQEEPNEPPTADAGGNIFGIVGQAVTFDGSASEDPDAGDELTYEWDFGDGETAEGETVEHTYSTTDLYTVSLTVTDKRDESDTHEVFAVIDLIVNSAPLASAGLTKVIETNVGEAVSFDATESTDYDGDAISYLWNFGDGATSTAATPIHTYTDYGVYQVSVTVTDTAGNTDVDSLSVLVNAYPVAYISEPSVSPLAVRTNTTIAFRGTNSGDPDGTIVSFDWDFGDGTSMNGQSVIRSFADPGTYTVTLTVTDDDGVSLTDTTEVIVENRPPVADAGPNRYMAVGDTLNLDGAASSDEDGDIVSYDWEVADDSGSTPDTYTGVTASHGTIDTAGTYHVTLTVTDDDGGTSSAAFYAIAADLNIADDLDPTGEYTAPVQDDPELLEAISQLGLSGQGLLGAQNLTVDTTTYALVDRVVKFDVSRSHDPGGLQTGIDPDAALTFDWDFDEDTTTDLTESTGVAYHQFTSPEELDVTVVVTDDEGGTVTVTIPVHILPLPNKAPVAAARGKAAGAAGDPESPVTLDVDVGLNEDMPPQSVTFDGSGSYDPDPGDTLTYSWDFDGDGSEDATGATPTYDFTEPGFHLVTLTVNDSKSPPKGDTDTMAVIIKTRVPNYPPVADAGRSITVFAGEPVVFDGSTSYDPDGRVTEYSWNLGNGATNSGASFVYAYPTAGTYTATLTVTDNGGATASDSASIVVAAPPPVAFEFDLSYSGSEGLSADKPLELRLFDLSAGGFGATPVATKSVTNTGRYLIRASDLVPAYDPDNDQYGLQIVHDIVGDGVGNGDYWGIYRTGSAGNVSYSTGTYSTVSVGTTYSFAFTDTNTATLGVNLW